MRRRDRTPMKRSLPLLASIVLVLCAGTFVPGGTPSAAAQVGYTGVPSSSSTDTYLGTYVGPPSAVGTVVANTGAPAASVPHGGAARTPSLAHASGDYAAEAAEPGDHSVVTGWDLVTIAALGLAGVVAFAVSAGRLRVS